MVERMRLKLTRIFQEWLSRTRTASPLAAFDMTLVRPFLILLAITLLSYQTVDLAYKITGYALIKEPAAIRRTVAPAAATGHKQRMSLDHYHIITERNLFQSTLKAVKDKEPEGGLVESDQQKANFDLKGTVACNSSFGYIFVEEHASKKQKLYRIGDMIGSAKLVDITRNSATIRSGGRDTVIKIKATIEGPLLPDEPERSSSRNLTLSKKSVTDNLANLNEIMKQAIVRPFMNKGVQEGFIISNIAPDSLYEKMGLKNGDIVIDVNNRKLRGASDLLQAVNLMQTGARISVNIKRDNNPQTINYTFE